MTVTTTAVKATYLTDAVTDTFAIPFAFLFDSQVKVYLDSILIGYATVLGAGDEDGGTLVFELGPPGAGQVLYLRRDTPLVQEIDLIDNATVLGATLEQALDLALMRLQEVSFFTGNEAFDGANEARDEAVAAMQVAQAEATAAAISAAQALVAANQAGVYLAGFDTDRFFDTIANGNNGSTDGQYFWVPGTDGNALYLRTSATPPVAAILVLPSKSYVDALIAAARADILDVQRSYPPAMCVFIGDSNWQFNHVVSASGVLLYTAARGLVVQAHALNPRFNIDTWCSILRPTPYIFGANLGVSGESSSQIRLRVGDALVQLPDFMIAGPPTNDARNAPASYDGGAYLAACLDNYQNGIIQPALDRGIKVICGTIAPMSLAVLPVTYRRTFLVDFNTAMAAWASGRPNVWFMDINALMKDPADVVTPGGVPRSGWTDDGIHWTPLASSVMAPTLNGLINQFVRPRRAYPRFDIDNVMPNWNQIGNTGTLNTGVTGAAPTGRRVRRLVGASCTAVSSLTANAETNGQTHVLDITHAGAAAYEQFEIRLQADTINVVPYQGKWVKAFARVKASGDGIRAISFGADSILVAENAANLATDSYGAGYNVDKIIESAPFKLSTETTVQPRLQVAVNPAVAGVTHVESLWMAFKVVDDPGEARYTPT